MADDRLAQKRNTGAKPMEAEPNHVREKTYDAPETPAKVRDEAQALPENETQDKVREGMGEATDKVKAEARKHG